MMKSIHTTTPAKHVCRVVITHRYVILFRNENVDIKFSAHDALLE